MLLNLEICDYLLINVQICREDLVKIYLVIFVQAYMKITKPIFQKVLI